MLLMLSHVKENPGTLPDRMKNIPETKARIVRCGRMCPMLLMTKAVKTKSRETIGKGVAVRTISGGQGGFGKREKDVTD